MKIQAHKIIRIGFDRTTKPYEVSYKCLECNEIWTERWWISKNNTIQCPQCGIIDYDVE
jgi:DNA-directed RNA polymerase subunit RPC12/RpoP